MSANYTLSAGHVREARARLQQAAEVLRQDLEAADLINAIEFWQVRLCELQAWISDAGDAIGRVGRIPPTPRPKIPVS